MNGNIQWKTKNLLSVESPTMYPPSNISFRNLPIIGIEPIKFVITTADQYDI